MSGESRHAKSQCGQRTEEDRKACGCGRRRDLESDGGAVCDRAAEERVDGACVQVRLRVVEKDCQQQQHARFASPSQHRRRASPSQRTAITCGHALERETPQLVLPLPQKKHSQRSADITAHNTFSAPTSNCPTKRQHSNVNRALLLGEMDANLQQSLQNPHHAPPHPDVL
eukprot:917044-Rhodomonas_salina.1